VKTTELPEGPERPEPVPPGFGPLPGDRAAPAPPLSRAQTRVLTALQAEREPVTLTDLSLVTGLHANTLRDHLDALESAGRIQRRSAAPSGPGRPRTLYEPTPADRSGRSEYAGLAAALASTIHRTSPDPQRDAAEAGEGWGHELAADRRSETTQRGRPTDAGDAGARREVVALLDEIGFAPESDAHHTTVRLTRCPLLDTARRYPDVVCAVHLGIVRGALSEYDADASGAELHPFAEPGACRLHLAAQNREQQGTGR
jgi:predicted ArsR family transcriptional regulator